jgi:hypothetical protein
MEHALPSSSFFRYSVGIPAKPKELRLNGDPRKWPAESRLPRLCEIENRDAVGDVYAMCDREGLYFGAFIRAKTSVIGNRRNPTAADSLILWIDTRDVHNVHRASRFCHEFIAIPRSGPKGSATAWQVPIRRAREKTPICPESQLRTKAKITKTTYGLTLAIPASALNGYDPDEFPRIGFTYIIFDNDHGSQTWSSPIGMPFDTDPSQWGTLELGG